MVHELYLEKGPEMQFSGNELSCLASMWEVLGSISSTEKQLNNNFKNILSEYKQSKDYMKATQYFT